MMTNFFPQLIDNADNIAVYKQPELTDVSAHKNFLIIATYNIITIYQSNSVFVFIQVQNTSLKHICTNKVLYTLLCLVVYRRTSDD